MNTELKKNAKDDLEKDFFKLMNNADFEKKNYEKCKKPQIYHVCNNRRKKELFSFRTKISYNKKIFLENLLTIEVKKTQIFMNKPVYLVLSILQMSKTVMV